MALIKLNIDSLKKESKGILNKLVDNVVNKIEDKLENAVEDLFAGALKKVGIADNIARQLSSRFGDAFSVGMSDKYFQSSTSEQNRVSPQEICENVLPRDGAETSGNAVDRINNNNTVDINGMAASAVNQYPEHIGNYYFSMKFANYVRPAPQARAKLDFKEAFILPLPRELKESFDVEVSPGATNMAGGIADAATSYFTGGTARPSDAAETLLLSRLVQAAGEFGDVIGQVAGAVPNPHIAAIFSGIGLRMHRFEWTFAPRNADESKKLQDIIWKLKANSLPSYSTNGTAALQYPQLVQIDLYPWASLPDEEKLIRFKPALLKDITINYAPQGIPSFFAGTKQPTFIQLSLEFLETEIWTGNQYGRAGKDRINEVLNLVTDSILGAGAREAIKKEVDSIVGLNNVTTPGQTPGVANPLGSTSSKSTPATQKIVKQSPAVKQRLSTIVSGGSATIAATNPDTPKKPTSYVVFNNASTSGVVVYSNGEKLVRTGGKYTVDVNIQGNKTRLGEFNTADAAYAAIANRGAF